MAHDIALLHTTMLLLFYDEAHSRLPTAHQIAISSRLATGIFIYQVFFRRIHDQGLLHSTMIT